MAIQPIPLNSERCSYRCPFYMDGAVMSICTVNNEKLNYGGSIPPLRTDRCKREQAITPQETA